MKRREKLKNVGRLLFLASMVFMLFHLSNTAYAKTYSVKKNNGLTMTVDYPDQIVCGTPTTFHVNITGGSGTYKYNLYSLDVQDGNDNTMVLDISRNNPFVSSNAQDGGYDYNFTFYASGTYYIRFNAMDMGSYQTINSGFQQIVLNIEDESYPSVEDIVDRVAGECLRECSTDYEKALWLNDWLVDHCKYDNSLTYCSAEGALARGTGTCEAYHRAYEKLLNKVGIKTGRMTGNGHVWTAVQMDGNWYQVDTTWNDAGYEDYNPNIKTRYLYFGLNDEITKLVHSEHTAHAGFESNSLKNNYYIRSGTISYWSDPKADEILKHLKNEDLSFNVDMEQNTYANILYNLVSYDLNQRDWEIDGKKYDVNVSYISADSMNGVLKIVAKEKSASTENPDNPETPNQPTNPVTIPDVSTRYTTHVQSYGWQGDAWNYNTWFQNGTMAGTSGKAKRLEAIKLCVEGNDDLGIQYTTHCQTYGWLPWSSDGEMNGTSGEAKRLEAIKIQLTGKAADKYNVYYRVHAQSYGWLGWAKNGECAGTAGYAKRLEGIQIVVLPKTKAAPGITYAGITGTSKQAYYSSSGMNNVTVDGNGMTNVKYRTHVQSYGWQGYKYNGAMSGTSGKAKRLEGIEIELNNKQYSGGICYTTHVQSYGWQGDLNNITTWKKDGEMSGTSGEAKRLEAICIRLYGEMEQQYDVYYRVHAQSYGWLGWAKNGECAGTAGYAKRLEGIQIVLVPKNQASPAVDYGGIVSAQYNCYISK